MTDVSQTARRWARLMAWGFACLVVLSLSPVAALAQDASDRPQDRSPATGHAAVIAQGVAPAPAAELVWQVTVRQADAPEQSSAASRAAGFVLADDGAVALADRRGALLAHLQPGEAAWAAPDAPLAVVSLGEEAIDYYDIALIPAGEAGEADVVGSGAPFRAPAGEAFDAALVRDVVTRGEESDITTGIAPGLLLVTSGAVRVETEDGDSEEVASGDIAAVEGDVLVTGISRAPATFVVATIGAAVPARVALGDAAPTPTPTPTPPIVQGALVTIIAFICPAGYGGADPAVDCTDNPAAGVEFTATANGAQQGAGIVDDTGLLELRGLPTGEYVVAAGVPGDFASSQVRCLNPLGEDIARRHAVNQIALSLAAGDQITCSWFIVPVDARGEEPAPLASVVGSAFICPVAYDGGDYAAVCGEPASGVEFILASDNAVVESVLAGPGGELAFQPVAAGEYLLGAGVPGDFASSRVSCLNSAGAEIAERAATNQIALSLPAGDRVTCAWYIVPEDARGEETEPAAAIGIAAFVCPAGFDGDYGAVCVDPADGVEFSIRTEADGAPVDAGVVGPGGDIEFGGLPAGDYVLAAGVPGDFASSRVRCLNGVGEDITRRFATNQIAVTVVPGDYAACNWYIVPSGEQG